MNSKVRTALTAPREILIEARKLVEESWGGGKCEGRDCAQTAISGVAASGADDPVLELFRKAARIKPTGNTIRNIWEWNDARRRTLPQVLAAFDRAIKQCAVGDPAHDATPQTVA